MCIACGGCRTGHQPHNPTKQTSLDVSHREHRTPSSFHITVSIIPGPPPLLVSYYHTVCAHCRILHLRRPIAVAFTITVVVVGPLRLLPSVSPCGKHDTLSPAKLAAHTSCTFGLLGGPSLAKPIRLTRWPLDPAQV